MITIVGLGAGDLEQLPLGIYRLLKNAEHVYLRTIDHPVVAELETQGLQFTAFDNIYERHDSFEDVYDEITNLLVAAGSANDIVYAVPGHPMVAEKVVQNLLAADEDVVVKGGQSFLDALFASLKVDPIEGFSLYDATDFNPDALTLQHHNVFCQVYNTDMASNVKLPLLEFLPPETVVFIVKAVGSSLEEVRPVSLFELDFESVFDNMTSVYVAPVGKELRNHELATLKNVLHQLRAPGGCPWDQAQTHESLKKNLIEETQELIAAIDADDIDNMQEELGDVLLQVMFHAQIAAEAGYFSIEDVIRTLNEKLIYRHPHVFGDMSASTPEEALAIWRQMKEKK